MPHRSTVSQLPPEMVKEVLASIPQEMRVHLQVTEKGLICTEQGKNQIEVQSYIKRLKMKFSIEDYVVTTEDFRKHSETHAVEVRQSITELDGNNEKSEVNDIIALGVKRDASDFHFKVDEVRGTGEITFRVMGDLDQHPVKSFSSQVGVELMRTMYIAMSDASDSTFDITKPGDGSIDRKYLPDELYGIRLAHGPILNGHYLVGRFLYKGTSKTFEALGYHQTQQRDLKHLLTLPIGIILFAGGTGSGKSTTLACALEEVYAYHSGRVNILTVEDPVEFIIASAKQMIAKGEGSNRAQAYAQSVKAMMRMDPDVAMISELRDLESVMSAVNLSLTGHQVWSTIHAFDTPSIIPRLELIGVNRDLVCDDKMIPGMIAQRLIKVLCSNCSVPWDEYHGSDKADITRILAMAEGVQHTEYIDPAQLRFANPEGCNCCRGGYRGREVVAEVVVTNEDFMSLAKVNDKAGMRRYMRENGILTQHAHARTKLAEGIVDYRDVVFTLGPVYQDIPEITRKMRTGVR